MLTCNFCNFHLREGQALLCFGRGGWALFHLGCAPWFDHDRLEGEHAPFRVEGDRRYQWAVRLAWLEEPEVRERVLALAQELEAGPPPPDIPALG
jgi:hypothetical protein